MKHIILLRLFIAISLIISFTGCQNDAKSPSVLDLQVEDYVESPYVWGYINTEGDVALTPQFDDARDFHENMAPAMKEGKWGYISRKGEWVISPQYAEAHGFYNGLARVRCGTGFFGLIDKNGQMVIPCEWQYIDDPVGSFFKAQREGKIDLLNVEGKSILPTAVESSTPVINDRAVVKRGKDYFLIQGNGEEAGPFDQVYLSDSDMIAYKENGQWGYLSLEGTVQIRPSFDEAYPFQDQRAVVVLKGEYHWIDTRGDILFSSAMELENIGEKCCIQYVDDESSSILLGDDGNTLIPDTLAEVHSFSNSWAPFRKDSLWNYLNNKGEILPGPSGRLAWPFQEGYARIITADGIGFVDTNGVLVIPPKFFEVKDFHEGLARFQGFR